MPDDPTPVENWEALVRLHRSATQAMDANLRRTTGHSLDDYDVLHQLGRVGNPLRMGELAAALLVANSSCHRIVGRLVEAGYVRRTANPDDGREVLVELTAEGARLRRRLAAIHTRDIEAHLGDRLSGDDHRRLAELLGRLGTP